MAMDDRRQAELQHNKHAPSGQTSGVRSACSLEYSVHPSAMHEPSDMAEPTRGGTRVTTSIDAVPPTPHERSSLATLFAVTSIPHSDQLYAAENYKEAQGDGGHSIPAVCLPPPLLAHLSHLQCPSPAVLIVSTSRPSSRLNIAARIPVRSRAHQQLPPRMNNRTPPRLPQRPHASCVGHG